MKYRILNSEGELLLTNLSPEEIKLFEKCQATNEITILNGQNVRHGKLVSQEGTVYLLSSESIHTSRPRFFKEIIYAYSELLIRLPGIISQISKKPINSGKRLLHNVRELNAMNVQELFDLVPEDELRRSVDQPALVRSKMEREMSTFSKALLRTIKNNVAIRNEISVFSKIEGGDSRGVKKQRHNIRRAFLSVFHIFFEDLKEKGVEINVQETDLEIYADYEAFEVAFFAILDNAIKYTLPQSDIHISFSKEGKRVLVAMEMVSLQLGADELPHIYAEEFSGRVPKKLGLAGKGFGMTIARKALGLNDASIDFIPNAIPDRSVSVNGSVYEVNQINLSFISVD